MQKNYIQFLVLALVAIGMVMIAGIRSDVNSLQSQVATGTKASINNPATSVKNNTTVNPIMSVSQIEETIKKIGLMKQLDGSYSVKATSTGRYYMCPTCVMGGECCVVNGKGTSTTGSCTGEPGSVAYNGLCGTARVATSTTNGGSAGEKPRACARSETCPQGQACKNGACVPCWGSGCLDGASRVNTSSGSTTTTNSSALKTTLKKGMISSDVSLLQKMLINLGYLTGEASGNFLAKTETAVKAFQTANGISPVSGIVGEMTRTKLNQMCAVNSATQTVTCAVR